MAEARLFQALADPTRLKIVGVLGEGPLNVTGIVNRVKAAQPAVSRHLRILREVGLIKDRRLGKEVEYSLEAARVREASGWLVNLAGEGTSGDAVARSRRVKKGKEGGHRVAVPGPPAKPEKKVMRISPLEARTGVGLADSGRKSATPGQEGEAGTREERQATGAGIVEEKPVGAPRRQPGKRGVGIGHGTSGARRREGRARKKRRSEDARKRKQETIKEAEPAYFVERDQDTMDDFLL